MCYPRGEFRVGQRDVFLGEVAGTPFYIGAQQFEYWQHTQLIIDVVAGRGGMFSLEGPTGRRFLTRSRFYEDAEWDALAVGLLEAVEALVTDRSRVLVVQRTGWGKSAVYFLATALPAK